MKDIMGMMKQVQNLQANVQKMQEELAETQIEGAAGGDMVKVTVTGKGDLVRIKIDPALLKADEGEILEDLIMAAMRDAKARVDSELKVRMEKLTGGLPLPPGLKLF